MKEPEYIKATNRVKITMAKNIITDTYVGEEFGISEKERSDILAVLYSIEARLFNYVNCEAD